MKPSAAVALAVTLVASTASAFGQQRTSGFWGAFDLGYGSVKRTFATTPAQAQSKLAMDFRGGYFWHPQLLLGLEAGGWTLQSGDAWDPSKGEGLSLVSVIAQYYPRSGSGAFLKAGAGQVRYWNNRPLENGGNGTGGVLGIGWDFRLAGSSFYLTPLLDYSAGSVHDATTPPGIKQDFDFRAITFRVGATYK